MLQKMQNKKNILITGASSGIGKASAKILSEQGHNFILLSRRESELNKLNEELGGRHLVLPTDVTNYPAVEKSVQKAIESLGHIDVVLNNAGLGFFDPFENGKIEQWHTMIDVNIKGLLNVIHTTMPHLKKSKGHLVNLGSVASHNVFQNSGVYCATKHAVLAISESIRLEMAQDIRVTTISPGAVNTEFINQTTNDELLKDYKSYFAAGMTPEIIGEQIAWAINAPSNVVLSEIMIRPNKQPV